jgi:hypothetical protein
VRLATVAIGCGFLAGCGGSSFPETRELQLGDACHRVPVESLAYFDPKSPQFATLAFTNAQVRESVPGYESPPASASGMRDAFYVGVFVPSDEALAKLRADEVRLREEIYYDLWYGIDEFSIRTVEPIAGTSLHRVKPLAEAATWQVVSRPPDTVKRDTHTAADFRIANCARIEGGPLVRCTAGFELEGVRMTLYTTEANLPLRASLARFTLESLAAWKSACPSGSGQ